MYILPKLMFSTEIKFELVLWFYFLSLLMENHRVYFICVRKGRMFCWLFHHVWKIKCCQNLHWTYFLKKSRLNYIKPQGVLVTVEKSLCSFYYTSRLECPYLPIISLLYYTTFWILFNILISKYRWLFFYMWDFGNSYKILWDNIFSFSLHISQPEPEFLKSEISVHERNR